MNTVSLKEYCEKNNIREIGSVFSSKDNNYPTIMMVNDKGERSPFMLSRNAGEQWPVGTSPRVFAKEAYVSTFMHETLNTEVSRISTGSNVGTDELFA
jgi:hypothetical protein